MRERPPQKKVYRPPKVRSVRVAPPHMFAGSGLVKDPDEAANNEPQQQ